MLATILLGFILTGIVGLLLAVFGGLLALAIFVFWIWMLVDAITNKGLRDVEKIVWVLVIIFLHALGALIYFLVGRSRRV